jgi:hypothetical protein
MTLNEALKNLVRKQKINKRGIWKNVFIFIHKPQYVIKTWTDATDSLVKQEYETSIKYPDLFARIDKINWDRRWMIQERLNTDQVDDELKEIASILNTASYDVLRRLKNMDKDKVRALLEFIGNLSFIDTQKTQLLILRWIKFLKEVDKIDTVPDKDINSGNMGYDKDGKLKLLDI